MSLYDVIPARPVINFQSVMKTADELRASQNVPFPDADLHLPVEANKVYIYDMLYIIQGEPNPDFRYSYLVPSGTTGTRSGSAWNASGGMNMDVPITDDRGFSTSPAAVYFGFAAGHLIIGSTSGEFEVEWAQLSTNVIPIGLNRGSLLRLWEVQG